MRDMENTFLQLDTLDNDPLMDLHGHSITYRIAIGPQQGRKVFTLQTIPAGFHRPAGSTGAEAAGEPDTFPWGICTEQPVPGAGDAGQAG